MSGHSKFSNIRAKKEKNDAAKGKIFTMIGHEIALAVKAGGPDPSNNSKLAAVIAKAKANNMPNDTINNGIKKAAGSMEADNFEELQYEGYGPNGVALIVKVLTDNKNRAAADIRSAFTKGKGSLATQGAVSFMFDEKGQIILDREAMDDLDKDFDTLMEMAIEAGAEDIQDEEDSYVIYTAPSDFETVRENIEKAGLKILSSDLEMVPENYVTPEESAIPKILNLIDRLEENDDVQNVFHNAILPEEEEED